MSESVKNQNFIREKLNNTSDPIMKDKLVNLLTNEIENAMLIDSDALKVIDPPEVPMYPFKPNKRLIMIVITALGLFFSISSIHIYYFFKVKN